MTTACPKGHESEWPDWCSVCGERLDAAGDPAGNAATPPAPIEPASSPSVPATAGQTCSNCGEPRHEHDVFCESCGYDFAGGSLPESATTPDSTGVGVVAPPMHAKVSIDVDFFAATTGDVDLELPDPRPETATVPLPGIRVLIGRQSTSRGIFPEIDVLALTGDPAVSSRHAMLERAGDGAWTLTDLGSTNGTFLSSSADDPIAAGVAVPIDAGAAIFIGAWTRIELGMS